MKITLITGMSGTGKSRIIQHLAARGFSAVDLDVPPFSEWVNVMPDPDLPDNEVIPGKDWLWNEKKVNELLKRQSVERLFVSGCASNMGQFYPYFDFIVLVTAPDSVMIERLRNRQDNNYGKSIEEQERVLRLKKSIEPLLRQKAHLEIDTTLTIDATISMILALNEDN
jgi:dephospho-CoA kinase